MPTMMQGSILTKSPAYAVLPAENLARARKFYHEVLGFEVDDYPQMQQFVIKAGEGSRILVYERGRTTAQHTAVSFIVSQLAHAMEDLRARGIEFEEYDLPGLKTENGVASMPEGAAAWFTDPEGNILNITEMR
ncbi:VOC family protein [bacterium]|nr:VOC family protein [bacterium]